MKAKLRQGYAPVRRNKPRASSRYGGPSTKLTKWVDERVRTYLDFFSVQGSKCAQNHVRATHRREKNS